MKVRLANVGTDRTLLGVVSPLNRVLVHLGVTQAAGSVFGPGQFNGLPGGQLVRNGVGGLNAHVASYDHPSVNFGCYRPYAVCDITGSLPGVRQFNSVVGLGAVLASTAVRVLSDSGTIDGVIHTPGGHQLFDVNFGPGPQDVPSLIIKLNGGLGIGDLGAPVVLASDEHALVGMLINFLEDGTPNPVAHCSPAAMFRTHQGTPC
jgi:hypothetical protein